MENNEPVICRPAISKGQYPVTNEEFMSYFLPHFAEQLRGYKEDPQGAINKAKDIACHSMKIERRYFCRDIADLHLPLSPQEQSDMFVEIGLKMAVPTVIKAMANAGVSCSNINCIVFVSHQPFPFPAFTAHFMNALDFPKDCSQIPVTSMGCAGGGFALDMSRTYLRGNPTHNVLVLCLELCSLGFRPHRNGMSWFLNSALFGDAVGAFVAKGVVDASKMKLLPTLKVLQLMHSKQRLARCTTQVSYFNYDEWGYDFVTTQQLCDVCRENVPQFARDLSQESFTKEPNEIFLSIIHPGGTRMIREIGSELMLEGSRSNILAETSMRDGGNIASVTVIDMLEKSWDTLSEGNELLCIGMGPGFVMCGAALRTIYT